MKINWTVKEETIKQEIVSSDNRWHISENEEGNFYLSNYDLLLTPHGIGSDYKTCFESFINDCDRHIEDIRKAQQEAREMLKEIEEPVLNGEEQG